MTARRLNIWCISPKQSKSAFRWSRQHQTQRSRLEFGQRWAANRGRSITDSASWSDLQGRRLGASASHSHAMPPLPRQDNGRRMAESQNVSVWLFRPNRQE